MDLIMIHTEPDAIQPNFGLESGEYFAEHFWGDKNLGFNVLYHNMKNGQTSIKELQDYIRESANVEELYAKQMMKLAKQADNCSAVGTFAPLMEVLRTFNEKVSSCHMDVNLKLQEIVKDLQKYHDEKKNGYKKNKEMFNATTDSLHYLQSATTLVAKSKEKYYQISTDEERLKNAGTAQSKELEKMSTKSKKSSDEYRNNVGKHAVARHQFEEKMYETAKEFQRLEKEHLDHLKGVMAAFITSFENSQVLINQVHEEFRRQLHEKSSDSILKQYAEQKGTGTARPTRITFEEFRPQTPLVSPLNHTTQENGLQNNSQSDSSLQTIPPPPTKGKKEGTGLFGRLRSKSKAKSDAGNSSASSKDAVSIESPEEQRDNYRVDEEGYTIRPDTPEPVDKYSFKYSSDSDSDSDSDAGPRKVISVKINPKEEKTKSDENNIEALNAITKNLTLGSPSTRPKKIVSSENRRTKKRTVSTKSSTDANNDFLNSFNSGNAVTNSKDQLKPVHSTPSGDNAPNLDLFDNFKSSSITKKPSRKDRQTVIKKGPAPPIPMSDSEKSMSDLLGLSGSENSLSQIAVDPEKPPPRPPKSLAVDQKFNDASSIEPSPRHSPGPLLSSESWSSLTSMDGVSTPTHSVNDYYSSVPGFASGSRGPSPLTLQPSDNIPIAVAFIETVNAYFKENNPSKTLTKVTGQVQISFPAGIMRAFTSHTNPPILSFKVCSDQSQDFQSLTHNQTILQSTSSNDGCYNFSFDMPALISHLKKMVEKKPNCPHYNIHIISYLVQSSHTSLPLYLSCSWNCEPDQTEVKVNYTFNSSLNVSPLQSVNVIVPVDGGVTNVQSTPEASWNSSQNRLLWSIPTKISTDSPEGVLQSQLQLSAGPSNQSPCAVQFASEGSTLSGAHFDLTGSGYRLSLTKKRFVSGKYLCDGL